MILQLSLHNGAATREAIAFLLLMLLVQHTPPDVCTAGWASSTKHTVIESQCHFSWQLAESTMSILCSRALCSMLQL